MAKFTPGPWKNAGHNIVDDKHKNIIASVENDANAQLIAAAPEMYGLLKTWVQIQAQPLLRIVQEVAKKLLSCIDGEEQE